MSIQTLAKTVVSNENWEKKHNPFITVITPVYNRRNTISRTIASVEAQTFRQIEYIIIDDGSIEVENIDDIVSEYMKQTDLAVLFVKKPNGGVHTARNCGYFYARGEFVVCIDSDDELLPSACDIFHKTWESANPKIKQDCWQIKARCIDVHGTIIGKPFPDNINEMSKEKAFPYFSQSSGEQLGCRRTDILKQNLFPEPVGVTFVGENVLWLYLEQKYRSIGINDAVRIYHTEGNDHLSTGLNRGIKRSVQNCRNALWNSVYTVNHPEIFICDGIIQRLKNIFRYCIMREILKKDDPDFVELYSLSNKYDRLWAKTFCVPAKLASRIYRRKRMQ